MPDVRASFAARGFEGAGNTPEQYAAFVREEHAKWGRVIREAGIKME